MVDLFTSILDRKFLNSKIRIILLILERYNCRAGEVLNATWENFHFPQLLVLTGSKRSNDIVIRDLIILREIDKLNRGKELKIFYDISYRYLYSIVKKDYSHLFAKYKTKKNYKVTHGFRFVNASFAKDEKQLKTILHHNSLRSGKYYNSNFDDKKK